MIATLTKPDVLAAIGLRTGDAIPAAIMADYARTAMFSLCEGLPITTQKLTGSIEERLRPLVGFRSRAIETFFTDEDSDDEPSTLKQAIDDLVEIGDFVSIGNGYYYPAPPRIVALDSRTAFVIGGAPARFLGTFFDVDTSRPTLARLASLPVATGLPRQALVSWLGAPTIELKQWTQTHLQASLEYTNIGADEWEVATFQDGPLWVKAVQLADLSRTFICREPRENVNGSRKFIARLERKDGVLVATSARPISNVDCRRLIHGQRLALGINRRVFVVERGEFFAIRIHRYSLPEVLRVLKAMCHHWTPSENGQLEFLISTMLRDSTQSFLGRYAMHLPPTTP